MWEKKIPQLGNTLRFLTFLKRRDLLPTFQIAPLKTSFVTTTTKQQNNNTLLICSRVLGTTPMMAAVLLTASLLHAQAGSSTIAGSGGALACGVLQGLAARYPPGAQYACTSSINGTAELQHGSVDFSVTEEQMTGQVFPIGVAAVAVAFNLPGVRHLILTQQILSEVYSGTVRTWDDPAIAEVNRNAVLPPLPIVALRRENGSTVGALFPYHQATRVCNASAMLACLHHTVGTIGHLGVTDVLGEGLGLVAVIGADGSPHLPFLPHGVPGMVSSETLEVDAAGGYPYVLTVYVSVDTAICNVLDFVLWVLMSDVAREVMQESTLRRFSDGIGGVVLEGIAEAQTQHNCAAPETLAVHCTETHLCTPDGTLRALQHQLFRHRYNLALPPFLLTTQSQPTDISVTNTIGATGFPIDITELRIVANLGRQGELGVEIPDLARIVSGEVVWWKEILKGEAAYLFWTNNVPVVLVTDTLSLPHLKALTTRLRPGVALQRTQHFATMHDSLAYLHRTPGAVYVTLRPLDTSLSRLLPLINGTSAKGYANDPLKSVVLFDVARQMNVEQRVCDWLGVVLGYLRGVQGGVCGVDEVGALQDTALAGVTCNGVFLANATFVVEDSGEGERRMLVMSSLVLLGAVLSLCACIGVYRNCEVSRLQKIQTRGEFTVSILQALMSLNSAESAAIHVYSYPDRILTHLADVEALLTEIAKFVPQIITTAARNEGTSDSEDSDVPAEAEGFFRPEIGPGGVALRRSMSLVNGATRRVAVLVVRPFMLDGVLNSMEETLQKVLLTLSTHNGLLQRLSEDSVSAVWGLTSAGPSRSARYAIRATCAAYELREDATSGVHVGTTRFAFIGGAAMHQCALFGGILQEAGGLSRVAQAVGLPCLLSGDVLSNELTQKFTTAQFFPIASVRGDGHHIDTYLIVEAKAVERGHRSWMQLTRGGGVFGKDTWVQAALEVVIDERDITTAKSMCEGEHALTPLGKWLVLFMEYLPLHLAVVPYLEVSLSGTVTTSLTRVVSRLPNGTVDIALGEDCG